MENVREIETKAEELLKSIQSFKWNPNSRDHDYNKKIEAFYEYTSGLSDFLKSMRPVGYFGIKIIYLKYHTDGKH